MTLNSLEELLSITEQFLDDMTFEEREAWQRIAAIAADQRDGERT
jgi:hypothetical protein